MTSSQLQDLDAYLARHGFASHPGDSNWLDCHSSHGIIRVVREPGEQTQLISLTPSTVCRYKATFSRGTPDAVIIAAVEAALSPASPQASRRRARQAPVPAAHA